jgi:deaminated glutathione amidase
MNFKAGIVQLRSSRNVTENLLHASALVRQAAEQGATFVLTPEVTNVFEPDKDRLNAIARTEHEDLSVAGFSALARNLGIHLHVGSLALKGDDGKLVNRGILFGPDGRKIAHYDKVHLFDIDLPTGESHRESATYTAGADAVVVKLPFASVGLAICYDVRFPKLFNALANGGANIIVVPAAFTVPTGEAHWHVLLRARAIETGSYIFAAAQGGVHDSGRATYGHSLVVSPWGEILAEAGTEPDVLIVDIDPQTSADARARVPVLLHARDARLKVVTQGTSS